MLESSDFHKLNQIVQKLEKKVNKRKLFYIKETDFIMADFNGIPGLILFACKSAKRYIADT